LLVEAGKILYAPISGKLSKATPYGDNSPYCGVKIETDDGHEIKIFYVDPATLGFRNILDLGDSIRVIENVTPIGVVQDLDPKYPEIPNHVHVEVWKTGPKKKLLKAWEWFSERWRSQQP